MEPLRSEQDWQAQQDARTLAEAKVIQGDVRRHNAAMAASEKLAIDEFKEAKSMAEVARTFYPTMTKEGEGDGV